MKRRNISKCRSLRKNQTDAEKKLWSVLRNRQLGNIKFRRQHLIDVYILDFYCPEYRLAIEVDGGQHYEDKGKKEDNLRSKNLTKHNIKILRFSNLDVLNNIEGVHNAIGRAITPHLNPLP